jgi:membrane-bound lytic murein transglycosylase C
MDFEEPMPLSDQPVLKDQLVTEDGKPVTGSNLNAFADEVVDKKPIEKKPVTGADEQKRVVVSVKLPLAPNSIQTRAEKFYEPIRTFAARYDLDPELVFAIMHTESYFNPKARSHVPAFGLMQIVPRYAGRDAYKFVHGEDRLLNENYLYEAEKNIELGAAYLHILLVRNFGRVNDPLSRLYCSIAAYNTGAGNVSRAFIGSTKLGEAIPKINQMNSSQVYEHLRVYLPYQETRDYIEKVTKRMNSYRDWMSN